VKDVYFNKTTIFEDLKLQMQRLFLNQVEPLIYLLSVTYIKQQCMHSAYKLERGLCN